MFNPPLKYWKIKDQGNTENVEKLSRELNVSPVISNLLVQRGICSSPEAELFFKPTYNQLHDPYLMKDMKKAVLRIEEAITRNERILIYGDYDVDGTTSVAIMYLFLKKYHSNIDFYVPNRYNEGYGISLKGIDYAAEQGIPLIIALDCGIKAAKKVKYAKEKGIDFIICDHHEPDTDIPEAIAVLDPKQVDCKYPFKELSGCGVGFKLIQAFAIYKKIDLDELIPLLDLVCVSIASDIVPLTGENRTLAYCGLIELNKNPRTGLAAIIKEAKMGEKEIAIEDIVFKIGPRINAAGRIESGRSSVELLISSNDKDAAIKGDLINTYNNERKSKDLQITTEALKLIETNNDAKKRTTVIYNPEWSKGVIGIVASRLIETYYRPTIVLTESNGFITGSARSVPGFDLYKALEKCSHLMETFGGHMYAAGLTLKKDSLKSFQDRFEKVVSESIEPEMLIPGIEVDAELKLTNVSPELYNQLKLFQPFGPGNMKPVFFTENVNDNGSGKAVGKEEEHLKLNIISDDNRFKAIPCIAFGLGYLANKINKGVSFDICYSIDENVFRGNTTTQLIIKDIQFESRKKSV